MSHYDKHYGEIGDEAIRYFELNQKRIREDEQKQKESQKNKEVQHGPNY
ncbi:hypothetical protein [Dickeya phage Mysterion]|uniref:Uncharacterized protein n=1 Tax=Dickeya phage Mysterion TaxID=2320193 RepID=A0A385IG24_9CAUD|nr:hypothetical protein HOU15_gp28 [Dickeya phage Mysterion]AXY81961.1 hypothetical protein [Dickeya phage Mysterion]